MQFDPLAALRCWPIDVELGGRTYRIPALPAAVWIETLAEGSWLDIVPGLLADAGDELDDALESGAVTHVELTAAARDALAAAVGARWWVGLKLVQALISDEQGVAGELLLSGVDMASAPLAAVVQAIYRVYTRHAGKEHIARLDMELNRPPEGVSAAEMYDEDAAADAFEAMARARGVA